MHCTVSISRWLAAAGLLLSSMPLVAAPVTNDLWDSSRAGFANATVSPGLTCGGIGNLFGGSNNTGGFCAPENATHLILSEGAGVVSTVTWDTAAATIDSFELNYGHDGNGVDRVLDSVQLAYWDGSAYVEFYSNGALALDGPLSITLGSSVTSTSWRATFTNASSSPRGLHGARLVELDGFGTVPTNGAVPEPGTLLTLASALGALALHQCKKARN